MFNTIDVIDLELSQIAFNCEQDFRLLMGTYSYKPMAQFARILTKSCRYELLENSLNVDITLL